MAKQKLDLSNLVDAESSRNNTAITGIIIMNVILALAYFIEVVKGARSIASYAVVALCCFLPTMLCLIFYAKRKSSRAIRYIGGIGFMCLYAYIMFTTSTDLVFCYIIVFFVILIVSGYGIIDEIHQSFVPGRFPSFFDWTADTLGAILGGLLCLILAKIIKSKAKE